MKQDKKKLYENIMSSVAKEVKKALNETELYTERNDGSFYNRKSLSSAPQTGNQAADCLMTFLFNEDGTIYPQRIQNRIEKIKSGLHNILFNKQESEDFIEALRNEWVERHGNELKNEKN